MAVVVTLQVDDQATNVIQAITQGLMDGFLPTLSRSLLIVQGEVQRSIRAWPSEAPWGGNRTGRLARSWEPEILLTKQEIFKGAVSSKLVYAAIHNFGGIIWPKKSKMLAIPWPGAGVPQGTSPRDYQDLQFVPGKHPGIAFLMQKRGDKLFPMFILKTFVKIKAKHYVDKAIDIAEPLVESLWRHSVVLTVERA